jgi:hypothetical protein
MSEQSELKYRCGLDKGPGYQSQAHVTVDLGTITDEAYFAFLAGLQAALPRCVTVMRYGPGKITGVRCLSVQLPEGDDTPEVSLLIEYRYKTSRHEGRITVAIPYE